MANTIGQEVFMSTRDNKVKVKPGILVDKEIWLKFKEKFEHPSEVIQALMAEMTNEENITTSKGFQPMGVYKFMNATDWQTNYDKDRNLTVTYSAATSNVSNIFYVSNNEDIKNG
jgi:hypothetical protein